jgi:hypothetical protein
MYPSTRCSHSRGPTPKYPDKTQRGLYLAGHGLERLPTDLPDFLDFFARHQKLMAESLAKLVGTDKEAHAEMTAAAASTVPRQ